MPSAQHDLLVIGGGPGGYVAAIRAAQLGLNTACVDKEETLGGTCVRVGCIPSKALLESSEKYWEARHELKSHGIEIGETKLNLEAMMRRKSSVVRALTMGVDGLFRKNKITRYVGMARFEGPGRVVVSGKDGETAIEAPKIIIATGSKTALLPGIQLQGDRICTSTEALSFPEVPRELIVIGAGYIGLEMASIWGRLGAKVTVLEYLNRILPGMDTELATEAQKLFAKQGMDFRLQMKVVGAEVKGERCVVRCENAEPLEADRVLVAVGRVANTDGLGLESIGLEVDEKGRIQVNERFATRTEGVYAIGDVIGGPMLAHKAEEEGVACVEWIVRNYGHVNYEAVPAVVYTQPEIASVGHTEDELKAEGIAYKKGVFPFRANGRARSIGVVDGFVKVLADAETDRVLGVHIIGPRAGDIIAEAAAAIDFSATSEDIGRCTHAHPTLAEALKEAALAVDGVAIHI